MSEVYFAYCALLCFVVTFLFYFFLFLGDLSRFFVSDRPLPVNRSRYHLFFLLFRIQSFTISWRGRVYCLSTHFLSRPHLDRLGPFRPFRLGLGLGSNKIDARWLLGLAHLFTCDFCLYMSC